MFKTFSALLILGALIGVLVSGCGGGSSSSAPTTYVPAAYGMDQFRPNYGGDLDATYIWKPKTITYRIVNSTAQNVDDIYLQYTSALDPTTVQANDIRDGFSKWGAALSGERTFQEVDPSDRSANIEVMIQNDITSDGTAAEPLGKTTFYYSDVTNGYIGRSVIQIQPQGDERLFRLCALHEEGHSIFALGHSRKLGDIMFSYDLLNVPIVGVGDIALTERDVNTVKAAYYGR